MVERLTETQFEEAIKGLNVGQQTLDIARGVLVEGKAQSEFVAALGLSKGAVSQAVSRVRAGAQREKIPEGYERVSAILPKHQAFIVKKWAEDATQKLETKK